MTSVKCFGLADSRTRRCKRRVPSDRARLGQRTCATHLNEFEAHAQQFEGDIFSEEQVLAHMFAMFAEEEGSSPISNSPADASQHQSSGDVSDSHIDSDLGAEHETDDASTFEQNAESMDDTSSREEIEESQAQIEQSTRLEDSEVRWIESLRPENLVPEDLVQSLGVGG